MVNISNTYLKENILGFYLNVLAIVGIFWIPQIKRIWWVEIINVNPLKLTFKSKPYFPLRFNFQQIRFHSFKTNSQHTNFNEILFNLVRKNIILTFKQQNTCESTVFRHPFQNDVNLQYTPERLKYLTCHFEASAAPSNPRTKFQHKFSGQISVESSSYQRWLGPEAWRVTRVGGGRGWHSRFTRQPPVWHYRAVAHWRVSSVSIS